MVALVNAFKTCLFASNLGYNQNILYAPLPSDKYLLSNFCVWGFGVGI